jgi:hypothetical protein
MTTHKDIEEMTEKHRFESYLAVFIDFLEKEAKRIDEERRGARRRDGGRVITSSIFLKQFITTLLISKENEMIERLENKRALTVFDNMDTRYGETRGEVRKYKEGLQDAQTIIKDVMKG